MTGLPPPPAAAQAIGEQLAERIAGIVTEEFGVSWLRLKLHKPGALRGSRDVGVMIERGSRG